MVCSNSKLEYFEKVALAHFEAKMNPKRMAFACNSETGVTVLVVQTGRNTLRVSSAVSSPDEKKFRAKVGRFYALERMQNDCFMTVPFAKVNENLENIAQDLAYNLAY